MTTKLCKQLSFITLGKPLFTKNSEKWTTLAGN